MQPSLLLLLLLLLLLGKTATAQPITVSVKNAPLKKVMDLIEAQSAVRFFYRVELLNKTKRLTLEATNVPLAQLLERCFEDQPLTYQIFDQLIVLKEKEAEPSSDGLIQPALPASKMISGRVITTDSLPVVGATVRLKGKGVATSTSSKGEFSIRTSNAPAILEVTSVGTEGVEVAVSNQSHLTIIVKIRVSTLDQVQIIGYGQTTRRLNTGNVTTITSQDIQKQSVSNVLAALQGHVPGMIVTQNTGLPGGSFQVNIRGLSSLQANSDPLFVVDGVPYPAGAFALNNDYKQGGNGLNLLNIGDVDQVDVLKDADATAIYGSRGGNGVVLITTKKAKWGASTIDLNVYNGIGIVTRLPKLLDLPHYLQMRREASGNDNRPINLMDNSINGVWDTTRSTNWQKELLGGAARITDAQLSVSGRTSAINYLLNGAYHQETTVMPVEGSDRHYSLHFHLATDPTKKKFKVQWSGSYQYGVDNLPAIDFTGWLRLLIPHQPSYMTNGNLNPDPLITFNPYRKLKELYKMNSNNLFSNLKISYTPFKNLELSMSLANTLLSIKDFYGVPTTALIPGVSATADYGTNKSHTFIVESQAFYQINLKRAGKLSVLLGSSYQKTASSFQNLNATNFSNDALLANPSAAALTLVDKFSSSTYKYLGTFSRLSYNLRNKYLLNLTGRIDGTSRFGPGKQFKPFGAVGAAWIFSEEKLLNGLGWLHLGKLRGSFGFIGNSNIGDYAFLATFLPTPGYGNYQGVVPVAPNRLYNPDLGWELRKSLELGLEFEFFKGRFGIAVSGYQNRNSQQLLHTTIATTTGFNSVLENSPATVENKGLEFVVASVLVHTHDLRLSVGANISFQQNKLLRYEGPDNSAYHLVVGQPITSKKVYRFGGVDPQTGTYFFIDRNGNPTTSPTDQDRTLAINTDPSCYGSTTSSVTYKGFALEVSCLFMVRQGKGVLGQWGDISPPGHRNNQPIEVTTRWRNPGDITNVAKFTTDAAAFTQQQYFINSSAVFASASYVRIRNVAVSYSVRKEWLERIGLKGLRFYLKGQNLLTFSKYRNLDPENLDHNGYSMAPLRVISTGFQLTL